MYVSLTFPVVVALAALSECVSGLRRCPNGEFPVQCFAQPCAVNQCPAYPTATCRDDYCGGCNARFYVGKREVTGECSSSPTQQDCPNGELPGQCFAQPCAVNQCPAYPSATCRDDYCGGCNARFYVGNSEVTKQCSSSQPQQGTSGCPLSGCFNSVQCAMDPCRGKRCSRRPNATCCSNYCGGCNWSFYENGQDVTSRC